MINNDSSYRQKLVIVMFQDILHDPRHDVLLALSKRILQMSCEQKFKFQIEGFFLGFFYLTLVVAIFG